MIVIVTGAAGFIGYHVSKALLARGNRVIGIDNLNDYYDPSLKRARLDQLERHEAFQFCQANICDREAIFGLIHQTPDVTHIVNLAAQAGVRYARVNPYSYVETNVMGQLVMMEGARLLPGLKHFLYASSSSVYGANTELPFSVDHRVDHPVSLYAATKRSGELMAESYAHLYRVPMTGLRFFTVYGPWGRPDMAAFLFAKAIIEGQPIQVFNRGKMKRDFTYIDDIVAGVVAALDKPPQSNTGETPHRVYNLGNHKSEDLMHFIEIIEKACGREAVKELVGKPDDDVAETFADIADARRDLDFDPRTSIEEGLPQFVKWYRSYYGV